MILFTEMYQILLSWCKKDAEIGNFLAWRSFAAFCHFCCCHSIHVLSKVADASVFISICVFSTFFHSHPHVFCFLLFYIKKRPSSLCCLFSIVGEHTWLPISYIYLQGWWLDISVWNGFSMMYVLLLSSIHWNCHPISVKVKIKIIQILRVKLK